MAALVFVVSVKPDTSYNAAPIFGREPIVPVPRRDSTGRFRKEETLYGY
jgi:hypothetical protein